MYFSLIRPVAGRERDAAHEWTDGPYSEHQWLWRLFRAPEGAPRDFLFRRWDTEGMPRFYVLSERAPQAQTSAWSVQTRHYAPDVAAGERLHFDLRANPVVVHSRDGKPRRHDVVMQEKKRLLQERGLSRWRDWQDADKPPFQALVRDICGAWLRSRASRHGFAIDERSLAVDAYQQHAENQGRLQFTSVDFSGELTVVDPVAFGALLRNGIGRAKAFGCGLMLVRRL